ncbi:MAG: histidinol dehydrogenase [Deltaproteobacteria bacterium CG11_big_fil_rev_8_21_14_0_20_45_16]|nr:MAG: histidinol dehydrogenase [Deltaproteobacteria bacterium CG11_big_fil_rev_8_21_14_0_20_45_16]
MKIVKMGTEQFLKRQGDLLSRRETIFDRYENEVKVILRKYREISEAALLDYAKDFDHLELKEDQLWIDPDLIRNSHKLLKPQIREGIELVVERVKRFQNEMRLSAFQTQEESGVYWGQELRAYQRVGVYVPKNYFLTLILCAVPARIAGVEEIIVATPPETHLGAPYVDPSIFYVCKLLGIEKILVSGGVGALAALAYGSASSLPVEKIVGPTNHRGMVAKFLLSRDIGIDGFTGPAEITFLTDHQTNPRMVAADIVAVSDHNPDAQVVVLNNKQEWMESLMDELVQTTEKLKDVGSRHGARSCLEGHTDLIVYEKLEEAIRFCNVTAPAQLSILIKDPAEILPKIHRCGSVVLGAFTPGVSLDIVGGATGLVSTLGSAAFWPATTVRSFLGVFNVVQIEKAALSRLQASSVALAQVEGFTTHPDIFTTRI